MVDNLFQKKEKKKINPCALDTNISCQANRKLFVCKSPSLLTKILLIIQLFGYILRIYLKYSYYRELLNKIKKNDRKKSITETNTAFTSGRKQSCAKQIDKSSCVYLREYFVPSTFDLCCVFSSHEIKEMISHRIQSLQSCYLNVLKRIY